MTCCILRPWEQRAWPWIGRSWIRNRATLKEMSAAVQNGSVSRRTGHRVPERSRVLEHLIAGSLDAGEFAFTYQESSGPHHTAELIPVDTHNSLYSGSVDSARDTSVS